MEPIRLPDALKEAVAALEEHVPDGRCTTAALDIHVVEPGVLGVVLTTETAASKAADDGADMTVAATIPGAACLKRRRRSK